MTRQRTRDEVIASLPPHKRGLIEVEKAMRAEARRTSPRGQAGQKGGWATRVTHPAGTYHLRKKVNA